MQENGIKAARARNGQKRGAFAEKEALEHRGRVLILALGLCFLLLTALLWGRFFLLQIIQGKEFSRMAARQHNIAELHVGRRGSILDRSGAVLASSVESYSLSARPAELGDRRAVRDFLVHVLGLEARKVDAALARDKAGFVWVQRPISDRQAKAVAESGLPGLYLQREQERIYHYKHLAGQLLGFVGRDNYGLEGLEASFDDKLSGRALRRLVQRDATGRRMYLEGGQDLRDLRGEDLYLTIDARIQHFAETAIARSVKESQAAWGGCLIIDVAGGEILAWAHYPFINPNAYASYSAKDRRNKLAMDALEQGSTIKPFVVAAAMQERLLTPSTSYDCENGSWNLHGKIIRDTRPHKKLTVEQILRYSSNIGAGKIGLDLGARAYGAYLQRLGFGRRTGLPLIGENPGLLRAPGKWPDMDLASSAFGQSFSATTLQMAQAYLCLANFGEKKPLRLILDNTRPAQGNEPAVQRVFSRETSASLLSMLKSVVHEDDGGGRLARIPGLEIGGKTGTAQKAEQGIYGEKHVASFVGLIPAEKPEYLVLAVVDEPLKNRYGAHAAAPVFKEASMETLAYLGRLPEPALIALAGMEASPALNFNAAEYARTRARQDALTRSGASSGRQAAREVKERLAQRAEARSSIQTVPDVRGMDMRQAVEIFAVNGIMPRVLGAGDRVDKQNPPPGTPWPLRSSAAAMEAARRDFTLWLGGEH